jgi:hypothetical protein
MLKNNIEYKKVCRLQVFGDDNVYNKVQYQYSTLKINFINAIRMRLDLKGTLGDVILSKNARVVVENAQIPALTNATTRIAVLVLRLLTSTEDIIFDTKKGNNGNPIFVR